MRTWWVFVLLGGLALAGCGDPPGEADEQAAGGESLRAEALDLPEVSRVGLDPPPTNVVVSVTRKGELRFEGGAENLGLAQLRDHLLELSRSPALRERDGSSAVNVLLDVDKTIPWAITQWILQTCADPHVKAYRIFFGATAAETGEDGALAVFLPKDRGLVPTPRVPLATPMRRVKLLASKGAPTDLRVLWDALQHSAPAVLRRITFNVSTPPPDGGAVPHGTVLRVVDLLLRAGVEDIVFEGAPLTVDLRLADAAWLAQQVERLRARDMKPLIVLDNRRLVDSEEDLPDLPTGGRVNRILGAGLPKAGAGLGEHAAEGAWIEEVVADPDLVRKEPVIKDEEIADHVEVHVPDGPFEGPTSSPTIGLGGGAGGAFRGRGGGRELKDPALQKLDGAVDRALRWLAAHQSPNGGWEAAGFPKWCDGRPALQVDRMPDGEGKAVYDPGVTGLALCAFLGAGYTNRGRHPFAKVVSRGLRYLKNIQDPDGCFGPRSTQQYVYSHAMAALAMVEAYGMTGSPIFKGSAQRALDFCALARNPYFAWRYGIKPGDNDTSVTAWMCSVLKSAQLINLDARKRGRSPPLTIDESAFEGVNAWLDKVTDPATGRVGYVNRGGSPARPQHLVDRFPPEQSESMTAAGVLCRVLTGGVSRTSDVFQKGVALIAARPPVWDTGSVDFYYWYYGTQALYHAGGGAWRAWKPALVDVIVAHQRGDGDPCGYLGSWDPIGPWGGDGGRVYATAILALTLEVGYRYDRMR